jgi:hypothetical protein
LDNNIIIKKGRERFDPKRTPTYRKARAIAEQKYAAMTDTEKKESHRNMNMSDMNLPGLPAFYPPEILYATGIGDGEQTEMLECGHKWVSIKVTPEGERTYRCKYGHEYNQLPAELFS